MASDRHRIGAVALVFAGQAATIWATRAFLSAAGSAYGGQMTFSAHTERHHLPERERTSANAEGSIEARIELLQRMPIFGGIRADVLQFLLTLCPVVFVPANGFFFREH